MFRHYRVERMMQEPHFHQENILLNLLNAHKKSQYGKKYLFQNVKKLQDYKQAVPVVEYNDIKSMIDRMMDGEKDILVQGKVSWFAKSSGTTSARSKYIPVTDDFLYGNIMRSCWDATSLVYANRKGAEIFSKKSLVMGGSLSQYEHNPKVTIGDVSAIMIDRMSAAGRPFYTPSKEIALMQDWEEKIELMAQECTKEDVVLFSGVPTWTIVLFKRILEITGKDNILEVWPNAKTYLHGGVGFKPYTKQFEAFLPKNDFDYYEVYNASEGYIAIQDSPLSEGMLLLLNNGIYYEFIPSEEWDKAYPETIGLDEVEIGKNYAIVISTASGLWRYKIGDTVSFTSKNPYRINVTGRTQHFINVFGEEVMVGNTDQAIAMTCNVVPAIVKEYTVAPVHLNRYSKGGHIWLIEFEKEPEDIIKFESLLDKHLRAINSDYDAKRYKDIALDPLRIKILPSGLFYKWLKVKGKVGGQHKVPRLSNSRDVVEELLELNR